MKQGLVLNSAGLILYPWDGGSFQKLTRSEFAEDFSEIRRNPFSEITIVSIEIYT